MEIGYEFEELINSYLGRPDYVTYATYWSDKSERVSLLFTVCLMEYDKHSSGEISDKLSHFMTYLFSDTDDSKKISVDCLQFLKDLKSV